MRYYNYFLYILKVILFLLWLVQFHCFDFLLLILCPPKRCSVQLNHSTWSGSANPVRCWSLSPFLAHFVSPCRFATLIFTKHAMFWLSMVGVHLQLIKYTFVRSIVPDELSRFRLTPVAQSFNNLTISKLQSVVHLTKQLWWVWYLNPFVSIFFILFFIIFINISIRNAVQLELEYLQQDVQSALFFAANNQIVP